ncbi:DUF4142 domain-containing protein [Archangium violaceum]|uniref:DUF4142 domain-containing protein n=1 Tax=Archangium violaceum TaxID=83451 RepID=UPI002B2D0D47|nr:DUF4142 domain-containing protein [Archangium violaceum]
MKRSWGRWALLGTLVVGGSAMAQGRPGASQQIPEQQQQPHHQQKRDPMALQATQLGRAMVADGVPAFLSQLQRINETEITLGELTHQKASSPSVQQYGEHMVQDHRKAQQQIADLAKQRNLRLDPMMEPTNDVQRRLLSATDATKAKLSVLQGQIYDQQYLASQVASHDETIQIVTIGRQLYPELAPVLDGLLPRLQEHRRQAYQLLGQIQPQPQAQAGQPQPQPQQKQARPPAGERR